jgi:hypothetical protein
MSDIRSRGASVKLAALLDLQMARPVPLRPDYWASWRMPRSSSAMNYNRPLSPTATAFSLWLPV